MTALRRVGRSCADYRVVVEALCVFFLTWVVATAVVLSAQQR